MIEITDKDYPPVCEVKVVKHTLYPISFIDSDGKQQNCIWNFAPTLTDEWVGESFVVETLHPVAMSRHSIEAKIEATEAELVKLKEML